MRQSTQRSIGAKKFSSSSVQDQILPKSGLPLVEVAIPPLPVFSGIPHPAIITSRDDAPRIQKFVVSVSGESFHISFKNERSFQQAIELAASFGQLFQFSNIQPLTIAALVQFYHSVQEIFAPDAFEAAALNFANNFEWSNDMLSRDRDLLHSLGSLDLVLEHHAARHRLSGMNSDRLLQWVPSDPRLPLLLTMANTGGEVDTDPEFFPFRHAGPLRPLQQRLLPVYRFHAHKMWRAGKGLLFRLADIPLLTLESMHTGNSCHLVPKPDTPEGRFIIDASNVSEGRVPLNGATAKEQAILRYGAVRLPNIRGVLTRWDGYRQKWGLQWSDLVIFKEDIKSCFNHLRWSTRSSKLLATMVDPEVVFVMLTGGFGHTSTPMQWDVVGQAILRRVEHGCAEVTDPPSPPSDIGPLESPIVMYVDDTFGAGRRDHAQRARDRVVRISEGVLAPGSAISVEKSVFASSAEILGYQVDCISATIRPKDRAIDKLFFVLFSFDGADPQPLALWQCLSSLVNMYSHVIRGMRPFVAAIIQMTCRAEKHHNRRERPSASAMFAIDMWRAAVVLLVTNRTCLSVSLDIFLVGSMLRSVQWKVISDASPWRLAAGLYDFESGRLICWTTLLLPYSSMNAERYQTHREYLGHLLSLLLIVAHKSRIPLSAETSSYQWVNDNTGAIAWANKHKCSSLASMFACMAVSHINLLTNVWAAEAVHIPGATMGEIDLMSRLEAQSDPLIAFPTLTPSTYLHLESPSIVALFGQCDPALSGQTSAEHHTAFSAVSVLIRDIILSFST